MLPSEVVDLIQHQLERLRGSEPEISIRILAEANTTGTCFTSASSSHLLVVILVLLLRQVVSSESPAEQTMSFNCTNLIHSHIF